MKTAGDNLQNQKKYLNNMTIEIKIKMTVIYKLRRCLQNGDISKKNRIQ